jgi:nucleotide-binding universal stress UspA family protein
MDGPIVVGTDGSSSAAIAVNSAIDMAAAFSQPLHIVSAYHAAKGGSEGVPSEYAELMRTSTEADTILVEAERRAQAKGVQTKTHPVDGDAADAILDTAEAVNAALIVIGNKGMSSKKRFLLGNVPSKVVHHAPCSTYVVHTT